MRRRNYFLLTVILIFGITLLWVAKVQANSTDDFFDEMKRINKQRRKDSDDYYKDMEKDREDYYNDMEKIDKEYYKENVRIIDDYKREMEKISNDFERRMDKFDENRREDRKINILQDLSRMGWVLIAIVCIFLLYKYETRKKTGDN